MNDAGLLVVGLAIAVGLAGIVVPGIPGVVVVLVAILAWTLEIGDATAWLVFVAAVVLIGGTQVAKYVLPERRLTAAAVPRSTLLVGAVVGLVGFFVIPVVGLVIGFLVGVYGAERRRLGSAGPAWASTKVAVRAVGLGVALELLGALAAAGVWLGAVLATR